MKKIAALLLVCISLFSTKAFSADVITEKSSNTVGDILGIVVDTTNEANALTSYYYLPLVQDGWSAFSAQHKITNATITYEGSNDLPNVANSAAVWSDITLMLTDGTTATFTTDGFLSVNRPNPWSRLRIKRVTTNAANEVEIRITKTIVR